MAVRPRGLHRHFALPRPAAPIAVLDSVRLAEQSAAGKVAGDQLGVSRIVEHRGDRFTNLLHRLLCGFHGVHSP